MLKGFKMVDAGKEKCIRVSLKYDGQGKKVIMGLKRISSPGLRVYAKKDGRTTSIGRHRNSYHLNFKGRYD